MRTEARDSKLLSCFIALLAFLSIYPSLLSARDSNSKWSEAETSSDQVRDLLLVLQSGLESENSLKVLRPHIAFPLELQLEGDTQLIRHAGELEAVWEELISGRLTEAVKELSPKSMAILAGGVENEGGHLRLLSVCSEGCQRRQLKIASLNPLGHESNLPRPIYTCHTKGRTYRVEEVKEEGLRLRSWSSRRDGRPAIQHATKGKFVRKSTRGCAQQVWQFKDEQSSWRVETLGCEDTTEAPQGTVGRLAQLRGFDPTLEVWCQLDSGRR